MHRRRQIERYLSVGLSVRAERSLRAHLAGCEACRDHYDRHAVLLRSLAGSVDEPTPDEHARMVRRALEGMGQPVPRETRDRATWIDRWLSLPSAPAWAGGLALAGVLAVVVPLAGSRGGPGAGLPAGEGSTLGELQERAVTSTPPVGLRVRCLSAAPARVLAKADSGPRAPLASLACARGNLLSFAPTNLSDEPIHVFAVGVAGEELRWYAPFLPDSRPHVVGPGIIDEPFAMTADTSAFPPSERVALYLLFSRRPLDGPQVRRELEQARATVGIRSALDRLPVDVDWQSRIELSVGELSKR